MSKFKVRAIEEHILPYLTLEKRYKFVNLNLQAHLSKKQFAFFKKVQDFCLNLEKEKNLTHGAEEDIYEYHKWFGEAGLISRMNNFAEAGLDYGEEWGQAYDFLRSIAVDMFDPQFNMSCGATTLCINPVKHHHENMDVRINALKDLVTGKGHGCICITEPARGSDATHMLTECKENPDGSFIVNGEKIYNTNAPVAKWAVLYATTEINNQKTMTQFLVDTSWDGWNCERVGVPWVPRMKLGHELLKDMKVPKEYVLGPVGRGRAHLFEGLVTERLGIACEDAAQCWGAVSLAAIYANLREQFKQPIIKFQGVGHLLAEYWSKTMNITLALLRFGENYDAKFEKFGGHIPKEINQVFVANASQLKFEAAALTERCAYEMANLMGGAGVCDNTLMHDLLGVTRIQEIVGGARQIHQLIMQGTLTQLSKML